MGGKDSTPEEVKPQNEKDFLLSLCGCPYCGWISGYWIILGATHMKTAACVPRTAAREGRASASGDSAEPMDGCPKC